jgi:hypothetical protein
VSDLAHHVRTFAGWADVDALLAAYDAAGVPGAHEIADPVVLSGQTGIRLREALVSGDARTAAALALTLDEPHRIELLLGAALRDARGDWAAARLWLAAETHGGAASAEPDRWWPTCRLLAEPGPDHTLDQLAAAYVAEGRIPEHWRPEGRPLDRDVHVTYADVPVAAALLAGVSGLALLDAFADRPLHAAVAHYYRRGTIHALGARALVILAASVG